MVKAITFLVSRPLDSPETGGELIAREIIDRLRGSGMEVAVVTLEDLSPAGRRSFLLANLEFAWRLLFRRDAHRVILENSYMHPWLFVFNFLARLCGKVIVVQAFHWDYPHMASLLRRSLDRIVTRLFLIPCHAVVTLSPTVLRQTQAMMWPRHARFFRAIPPGCNYAGEQALCPPSADGTKQVRLLCAANYDRRKGLDFFLQAVALLKREEFFPRLHVSLAGSDRGADAYFKELQALVAQEGLDTAVSFLGWQERDQMRDLYRRADVFVLPTLNEGFGMVLVEAMVFGLPIVATRVGPIPELVADGVTGLLVPPRDAAALAYAIGRLAQDDGLRAEMGRAARARSHELALTWEESTQLFAKVLEVVA